MFAIVRQFDAIRSSSYDANLHLKLKEKKGQIISLCFVDFQVVLAVPIEYD